MIKIRKIRFLDLTSKGKLCTYEQLVLLKGQLISQEQFEVVKTFYGRLRDKKLLRIEMFKMESLLTSADILKKTLSKIYKLLIEHD